MAGRFPCERAALGIRPARIPAILVCSLAFSLSTACIVVPKRGKIVGPGGTQGTVDLRFLKNGLTHREEVRERLQKIDLRVPDEALFWGRWAREWNIYWFAAGGGQTAAVANGGKETVWRRRNLLIDFDSSGRVSAVRAVGDGDLLRELAAVVQSGPAPAGSELTLTSRAGEKITLKDGKISFSGRLSGAPRFACEFEKLTRLKVAGPAGNDAGEDRVSLRLETSITRSMGRRVQRRFDLYPTALYELVKFAQANGLGRILSGQEDER